jgi:hypothetical protein
MKHLVAITIALVASRTAAADPPLPRVLTAPTAWLPPEGSVVGMAGVDHRGDGSAEVGFGLGGLASFELDADTDARECAAPPCAVMGTDNLAHTKWQARGAFRMGLRQDMLFKGSPALVLGFRTAFGHVRRLGEAYLVASRAIGLVRLHAGVAAMDAQHPMNLRMGTVIRPLAGLEITPPQYPKTTLMGDIAWIPRFEPDDPTTMKSRNTPEWVIGWGVRYQALTWGSIELDVRHRESEDLGASTVMVRINGVLSPSSSKK